MAQAPRAPTAVALLALPLAVSLLFPGMARAEATRDRLWREDLGTFATQLRAVHPKPGRGGPRLRAVRGGPGGPDRGGHGRGGPAARP